MDQLRQRGHDQRKHRPRRLARRASGRISSAASATRIPRAAGSDYNENSFLALVPYANVSPGGATGGATLLLVPARQRLERLGPERCPSPRPPATRTCSSRPTARRTWRSTRGRTGSPSCPACGATRSPIAIATRSARRSTGRPPSVLSLRVGGDLDQSDYPDSRYGLTDASNRAVNAEGTYASWTSRSTSACSTPTRICGSGSAGNTFTVNSNGTAVNGATGLSGNQGCNNFTTLQQRNNNAKLDPCLDWTTARQDKVHTVGLGHVEGRRSAGRDGRPHLQPRAFRQRRDRRQLRQQPPDRSGRAADEHRGVLHSGDAAAHRQDRHDRPARCAGATRSGRGCRFWWRTPTSG